MIVATYLVSILDFYELIANYAYHLSVIFVFSRRLMLSMTKLEIETVEY